MSHRDDRRRDITTASAILACLIVAAPRKVCTVPGCGRHVHARGFCYLHYQRVRAHGDPHADVPVRRNKARKQQRGRRIWGRT